MENEFDAVLKHLHERDIEAAWETVEGLLREAIAEAVFTGQHVAFDAYGFRFICPPDMSHVGVMVL